MSLTGKIFAVLNIVGMIVLVVFAALAYSRREAWKYANFKHDLALRGLPLHEKEHDEQGYVLAKDIPKQLQKELFPSNPVTTQMAEVNRVQQSLQKKIDAAGDDPKKQAVVYANFLLPLARTNTEREDLLSIRTYLSADDNTLAKLKDDLKAAYDGALSDAKAADAAKKDNPAVLEKKVEWAFTERTNNLRGEPRRPFVRAYFEVMKADAAKDAGAAFDATVDALHKQLKDQLDGRFNEVLTGKHDGQDMAPQQRRDAVSELLFNLVEAERPEPAGDAKESKGPAEVYADPAYKRYLAVVGLVQAGRTINRQAQLLSEIAAELEYEVQREQAAFAGALTPLIEQAKRTARSVDRLTDDVARENGLVAKQETIVNQRKKDVAEARKELDNYQQTMAQKYADLRRMSDEVFKIRVQVRDATVVNQEHERTIRKLEGQRWLPFVGNVFLLNREEP